MDVHTHMHASVKIQRVQAQACITMCIQRNRCAIKPVSGWIPMAAIMAFNQMTFNSLSNADRQANAYPQTQYQTQTNKPKPTHRLNIQHTNKPKLTQKTHYMTDQKAKSPIDSVLYTDEQARTYPQTQYQTQTNKPTLTHNLNIQHS